MMSDSRSFQTLVKHTMIEYAFFRWESAVTLGMMVGGTGLSFYLSHRGILPSWAWGVCLAVGLLAEIILVFSSLSDKASNEAIITRLLQQEYYPEKLLNKALQAQIDKAFAYHSRLENRVNQWRDTSLKNHLNETAEQIRRWLKTSYTLAQRIDLYLAEYDLLKADKQHAVKRLNVLNQQLTQEKNADMRHQLELTISSLQRQVDALQGVDNTMKQAQLQLEHTVSAVGTIYSQTLLIEARALDGTRLQQVRQDVAEEVSQLTDILSAMQSVYQPGRVQ